MKPGGGRAFFLRALIAAAVALLAAAAAEIACRLLGVAAAGVPVQFVGNETAAGIMEPDRELFWRLKPRGGHDPVHEIGVRGEMFPVSRGPRDLRVLCVGDSCTYGLNVRLDEAWGRALDRRLQDRLPDLNVETVLAGTPGWSTHQDVAFLRRHGAALAADATILYVGAWNDLLPAAGFRDSEYAAEIARLEDHPFWSLRVGRLTWRALHPIPTVEQAKRELEASRAAGITLAPRVTVPEFVANVRALVERGRATGVVIGVIPPVQKGRYALAWSGDYRAALIAAYRELGVPSVDGDEAFRAYAARPGAGPAGEFLTDAVHPSGAGHAAIAEALDPVVFEAVAARARELASKTPPPSATIESVEPGSLPPGRPAKLVIRGTGFGAGLVPPRVFVNGCFVGASRVAGDARIEADVLPGHLCRPGPAQVSVRIASGVCRAPEGPVVQPWTVDVSLVEREGRRVFRVSTQTESALLLHAWVSPALLDQGRPTAWGPFRLKDPAGDHPEGTFAQGVSLLGLRLPFVQVLREEPGPSPLSGETALPAGFAEPLFAQVMIRWGTAPEAAWLSDVLPVRAP